MVHGYRVRAEQLALHRPCGATRSGTDHSLPLIDLPRVRISANAIIQVSAVRSRWVFDTVLQPTCRKAVSGCPAAPPHSRRTEARKQEERLVRLSWIWSLLGLLLVSGLSYGIFRATRPNEVPAGFLYGNGHIEGTEIRISSEVPGRVTEHALGEGATVSQGQTVVLVDAETSWQELRARQGELAALRDSMAAMDSQIATWMHHVDTAGRQLERARRLRASNLAADEAVEQAEDALREAEGQLGNLRFRRDALGGQIASAAARVQLAETAVDKTEVRAPADGTVLVRAVEVGEFVQAGEPLALIVDLERLELKVYIPERNLGKLQLGNAARLRINAFPERYFDARVARVDDYAQFTPRDIHVPEERTRMVYGVMLVFENPDGRLKPGMPADAWIRWDAARDWPETLPVPVQ